MNKIMFSFWKNKNLTEEEKRAELVNTCRKVFGTDEGKIVLNMLLTDLFMFEKTHIKREQALNDYAKFFVRERLGVSDTKALTDFIAETAASGEGK